MFYRRILYYLEYVFGQMKEAVEENCLQPTSTAKKRKLPVTHGPFTLLPLYMYIYIYAFTSYA